MAEMLTDLIQNIYGRIAGLGKSIQDLKASLDALNANIEDKVTKLSEKIGDFSKEIDITKTKHIETIKTIGEGVTTEFLNMQRGLGLMDFKNLIENLENFSVLSSEILNQDTVNLLLSEAIESVKSLKTQIHKEEE